MTAPLQLGRYSLFAELASGGMATVYLGRMNGEMGFGRTVAIKRLHPHTAREPEFVSMFLDEARLAARVQHPNVVTTLDIVNSDEELFLVMEYVQGASLGALVRTAKEQGFGVPVPIAVSIAIGYLSGLHAAHEANDEEGRPLGIVHRDVSPQNVLVGTDGVARLLDFGVARAATRLTATREGQLKGKLCYMAPEQLTGEVTRQTDVYAAGVVLWEVLTGQRLFQGDTDFQILHSVTRGEIPPPSRLNPEVSPELDRIVLQAVVRDPSARWPTAQAMAHALDEATRPASSIVVGEWVQQTAGPSLRQRAELVAQAETSSNPRGLLATMRAAAHLPWLGRTEPGSSASHVFLRKAFARPGSSSDWGLSRQSAGDVETVAERPSRAGSRGRQTARYAGLGVGASIAAVALLLVFASPASRRSAAASPGDAAPRVAAAVKPPASGTPAAATPWTPVPEDTHSSGPAGAVVVTPVGSAVTASASPSGSAAHAGGATRPSPATTRAGSIGVKHLLDTR
jgi:serine/threonine-protein kinase